MPPRRRKLRCRLVERNYDAAEEATMDMPPMRRKCHAADYGVNVMPLKKSVNKCRRRSENDATHKGENCIVHSSMSKSNLNMAVGEFLRKSSKYRSERCRKSVWLSGKPAIKTKAFASSFVKLQSEFSQLAFTCAAYCNGS